MSRKRWNQAAALVGAALLDMGRLAPTATPGANVAGHVERTPSQQRRDLRKRHMAAVTYAPPRELPTAHGLRPIQARADARRRRQIERGQLQPTE